MSAKDVQFLEGLFLTAPANKYVCPICLCAVQREAFLTQCCGSHFCKQCISRIVDSGKPCPLCETLPLVVFPNKERQREINSLPVCCPVSLLEKGKIQTLHMTVLPNTSLPFHHRVGGGNGQSGDTCVNSVYIRNVI